VTKHYNNGDTCLHAYVTVNPQTKTLTLLRQADGEPVTGRGWMSDISIMFELSAEQTLRLGDWIENAPKTEDAGGVSAAEAIGWFIPPNSPK
jgi:hypothetical protein